MHNDKNYSGTDIQKELRLPSVSMKAEDPKQRNGENILHNIG